MENSLQIGKIIQMLRVATLCLLLLCTAGTIAAFAQTMGTEPQSFGPPASSDSEAADSIPYSAPSESTAIPCTGEILQGAATVPGSGQLPSMPPPSCPNSNEAAAGQSDDTLRPAAISQPTMPASLMAQPQYGKSPLTVDFFVIEQGSPQTAASTTYAWNFGDGTMSSLPPQAFVAHVYQRPGTYFCSLIIMSTQSGAGTLLTSVLVRPGNS
jgi:PKD repeat protein